jgi:hypothetical protein
MSKNEKLPENFFKYDAWIQEFSALNKLPWKLVKAQVWQESEFDHSAMSPCGAQGLLQLMPETAKEMAQGAGGKEQGETNLFEPDINISLGVKYERWIFDRFPEISKDEERFKFMLAAYNGGRGYVNKAIEIAYDCEFCEPIPSGHHNARPGRWQTWCHTSAYLCSPYCIIKNPKTGKTLKPDYRQMLDYVDHIWEKYEFIQVKTLKVVGS